MPFTIAASGGCERARKEISRFAARARRGVNVQNEIRFDVSEKLLGPDWHEFLYDRYMDFKDDNLLSGKSEANREADGTDSEGKRGGNLPDFIRFIPIPSAIFASGQLRRVFPSGSLCLLILDPFFSSLEPTPCHKNTNLNAFEGCDSLNVIYC